MAEDAGYKSYLGYDVSFKRYSKKEIVEEWDNLEGQGNKQSRERGDFCVLYPCDEDTAIILTALLVRNVFAIPSCASWENKQLSFYFGDCGLPRESMKSARNIIWAYELVGVDEHGQLFEEAEN